MKQYTASKSNEMNTLIRQQREVVAERDALKLARFTLAEALKRLLNAFEADKNMAPQMDIVTSWETNGGAIQQARDALEKYPPPDMTFKYPMKSKDAI